MNDLPVHNDVQPKTNTLNARQTGITIPTATGDDEIDLIQLLMTLWGGKIIIALAMAIGVAVGALFIANTKPSFQAEALLQLEEKSGSLSLPSSLADMSASDPRSETEIQILTSRMVLAKAVAKQNLDWNVSPEKVPFIGTMLSRYRFSAIDSWIPDYFIRPNESIGLEYLVVPPEWLNREIKLTVLGKESYQLILPNGRQMNGIIGQRTALEEKGFSLTLATIDAPIGRHFTIMQTKENNAIDQLRSRLSISERGRATGILDVRLTGGSKPQIERQLNAIIKAYINQNVARSAAEADSSIAFIKEQLPQAKTNLREAEEALNKFRQQQLSVNLSLETQNILEQVNKVTSEIAELQRREDELSQRYTIEHPIYRALLVDRQRLETLQGKLNGKVSVLPETQRKVLNLTRSVALAQGIFTELLTRLQEVEVLRASTIGNVRIIDSAAAKQNSIAPRKKLIIALAMMLGGMTGIALVLIRSYMRKGIQDVSELEKMGLPVFATINYNTSADTGGKRKGKLPILALEQTADLTVEALRSLRTSLHFGMLDAKTSTLCITSSHPEAGKSFLAVNLAIVAAQAGQRVCLIDTDMRRGQLRRFFDVPRDQKGLAEVLAGDLAVDQAAIQGPIENLYFLPTGSYPPNPSELLMRPEFSRLIDWCSQNFDLAIFDSPPALAVTDPIIVSRNTGSTLFVARHEITQAWEVEATIKTFSVAGLHLSGAILNGFKPQKGSNKYGYGYGYGYGYRYDYKNRNK